jgi:hypothetical protein
MSDPDLSVTIAALHRCGRCRQAFPLAADDAAGDWWVCEPCRAVLMPGSAR